jgi:hypothetical protein
MNKTENKTNNIELTEMWHNQDYIGIGKTINSENWSPSQVAEFCAYFAKYVGLHDLNNLYKFL